MRGIIGDLIMLPKCNLQPGESIHFSDWGGGGGGKS